MDLSSPIIHFLLHSLFLVAFICPINSSKIINHQKLNQTLRYEDQFNKLNETLKSHFQPINKFAVKAIQSLEGDIIDCVLIHKQPAFNHPLLKGHKLWNPPKKSKGHKQITNLSDSIQSWSLSGEFCPEGTIPIRRRKDKFFERKDISQRHYHATAIVEGGFTGAKANINIWTPSVEKKDEFSAAKIWIISQSFSENIEVGWQVFPGKYGDNKTRFFVYWTADGYNQTGCYNLECPGFIQTNPEIYLERAIDQTSTYNSNQYGWSLRIEKDTDSGHWWLGYGEGHILGYWPSNLFKELKGEAHLVQFGGEVLDINPSGYHTATSMGSGHFAEEGFGKAAYFNNNQVKVSSNVWIDPPEPKYSVDHPKCYNLESWFSSDAGFHFYYGGPGRNGNCLYGYL
ncbi:protein neprosin-like [Vicia villosa]|uniref:protein neprosin-like n=1 Tax=Vicia villosa TaxID=3911 RepID=UPI00273CF3FE|nr:protein neprosin-like [Vicia villosa]